MKPKAIVLEQSLSASFLIGVFGENARLLQWLVFVRQFNAIDPFFCSFVQHHQLELRTSKTYSKRQNLFQNKNIDVQNLENIRCPPLVFFTRIFSPLRLFRYFTTQWMSKNLKGSPFTFFGTVQKSHFKNFFPIIFKISQRSPFDFLKQFATNWISQGPKGPPYYNFEP